MYMKSGCSDHSHEEAVLSFEVAIHIQMSVV